METQVISSVTDAINLINSTEFRDFIEIDGNLFPQMPVYNQPFGIWFRGESDNWDPVPTVFRNGVSYDETAMIYHFQSRAGHKEQCRNTFDWLCLMRHFELPVRLLDWSENLLTALFFASSYPSLKPNGKLHILNALKLNVRFRSKIIENYSNKGIAVPMSIDTAIRAEMGRARSLADFVDLLASFDRDYAEDFISLRRIRKELDENPKMVLDCFSTPIAVLPHHLDTRIVLQQSAFTIHGGKLYKEDGGSRIHEHERLPEPDSLVYLNKKISSSKEKFLCSIDVTDKGKIREELKYLGIHEGSLFPELDHQSKHIVKSWSYHSA